VHFGHGNALRCAITARLERIYELARRTGSMQRFILFGSYVTTEPSPRDVDIFLVMRDGFQPRDAAEGDTTPERTSSNGIGNLYSFGCKTHRHFYPAGGTGTCVAMAPMQALNARAMATTT
jgi:hypothetical protein